ncbi:6-bladed beta-propeller [Algoriphagus pacificus]|uniref:6-bladed beta-propeller n=1 Tax=Algoriphagus pacificus TaxID=2811234 RepID=A0ABS3CIK3_9BACT|nr:6-bladed beta-propeller [Algoriphagus pacificus]MBN7816936.1 6-bladed beta-propeller [Algoriphagus pacificus]
MGNSKFFLYFLICIIFSCDEKEEVKTVSIQVDKIKSMNYSDVFDSIEYILLKDSDQNPLVQPYKIIFSDKNIFVEDQQMDNLFIFSSKGEFIKVLESTGGGPGEFDQIQDFQVKNGKITIMDAVLGKFIEFDQNGKFLSERRNYTTAENFLSTSGFDLYFFNNLPSDSSYNFLVKNDNIQKYFVPLKQGYSGVSLTHLNGFMESMNSGMYYIDLPLSYNVFEFDKNGWLNSEITFDFGTYNLDPQKRLRMKEDGSFYENIGNVVGMLDSFFPIGENFVTTFSKNGDESYLLIYDKQFNLLFSGANLKNDFDGLEFFKLFPWSYYEKGIVLKLPSYYLSNLIEKYGINPSEKSNLQEFYNTNKELLKEDMSVFVKLKLRDEFL